MVKREWANAGFVRILPTNFGGNMLTFDLWKQVPQLNTKIDFTRLPVVLEKQDVALLARINGMISLGELSKAFDFNRLEIERIVTKLVKNDLIFFDDNRVRRELMQGIDVEHSDDEHLHFVDEQIDKDVEAIDHEFEATQLEREVGEWDLDSIFRLINRLSLELRTGLLRIQKMSKQYKVLYFDKGKLVNVTSVPFDSSECLGRILQRAGRVNADKVVLSLERAKSSGRLQGEELVAMGVVRRELLPEILRVQMEVKLNDIMLWETGQWEFQSLAKLPAYVVPIELELPRILFALIWKRYPFEALKEQIDKRAQMYVGHVKNASYSIDDLAIGKSIQKFYKAILEKDSLVKRVLIVSHMKPDQTYRVIWGLYLTGMIDFFQESREDKSLARIEELQQRLKSIERESMFDVLGVHWTSNDEKVRIGYEKRVAEQEKVLAKSAGLELHLQERLLDDFKKAYERIKTIELRRAYRNEIFDSDFIVFGSDILRQKGESYLFTKEETDLAIDELTTAIEVYDRDGEYYATLGLAQFYKYFQRDIASTEDARRMVRKGYTMKPQSEVTNLCMGLMYKREKRKEKAVEYLTKVVNANPRNRFAALELEEAKTGKTIANKEEAIRDFLNRRSKSDEDFDKKMKEKKEAKS